jgi:hypothetical protein
MRTLLTACAVSLSLFTAASADEDWRQVPLVQDGKLAPGWKHVGFGAMAVEDGTLRTEPDQRGLGLVVWTKEKLGNCELRVVYRTKDARSNAGVIVRLDDGVLEWIGKDSPAVRRDENGKLLPEMAAVMQGASEKEQGAWYAVHHGYEVQICDTGDPIHRTGSIYSLAPAAELPKPQKDGWRTMIIALRGDTIAVAVDGKPLTKFDPASTDLPDRKEWYEPKRDAKRPTVGYIGLQTHDPGDTVWFKEVSVRPLR